MPTCPARYDLPWKFVLTHAFHAFMTLYFEAISREIDWSRRPRFLDKELAQVGFGDAPSACVADKLVAVYLRDGGEHWVLIHVEVQAQHDEALARRVLAYNYRIFEQHARQVASLVVLADDDPAWRPRDFHNCMLGTEMGITFATVKLLDFSSRIAELEASSNPFALVTLAHLYTQRTRHSPADRYAAKWQLTKLLFRHGWSKKRIIVLFKAINWMMTLPVELERRYWQAVRRQEREHKMEWICPLEQMFMDKGWQKGVKHGLKQGLERGLEQGREQGAALLLEEQLALRFGPVSQATRRKLAKASLKQLKSWSKALLDAHTLKQVFA